MDDDPEGSRRSWVEWFDFGCVIAGSVGVALAAFAFWWLVRFTSH